jgi:TPR repeat protein
MTDAPSVAETFRKAASLFHARRYDAALELYRSLANDGYVQAQQFLGWMYARGQGTAVDYTQALHWLEKAASQGSVKAMFFAGRVLTESGRHAEALKHYRAAESHDYAPALYRLGVMYRRAQGVPPDRALALTYLSRAANKGHFYARRELAIDDLANALPSAKLRGLVAFAKLLPISIRMHLRNRYSDNLKG